MLCDDIRVSGTNAIFCWTIQGTSAETGNAVLVPGWEEWTLTDGPDGPLVAASRGFFDAAEFDRQVAEGV